jgi:hypothetical protein
MHWYDRLIFKAVWSLFHVPGTGAGPIEKEWLQQEKELLEPMPRLRDPESGRDYPLMLEPKLTPHEELLVWMEREELNPRFRIES